MDYSAIHHDDPEHPVNGSPWATSPQINKTAPNPSSEYPQSPARSEPNSTISEPSLDSSRQSLDQQDPPPPRTPRTTENGQAEQRPTPGPQHGSASNSSPQSQPSSQQQTPYRPKQAQRYHGTRNKTRQDAPSYKLQPKITGIERPSRKELIVRFDIYVCLNRPAYIFYIESGTANIPDRLPQTNLPTYRTTQFRDCRRTHAEFEKLTDHLISANPEALVPALPPSSTPAGIGTDEDEVRVKANLQRWMTIVCSNPVLMRDDEMVRFIEGDPGYSPVIRRSQPATGVRRKYLKQFGPPPDENVELQDARPVVKQFYLAAMDAGQKVDKVVRSRRSLGLSESDFGTKLAALTDNELHPGLKLGYRKLGKTIQTVGDLHAAQGTAEATVFSDPMHYHSADAFIVKETFTNRHILLRDLIQASQHVRNKINASDRLKASTSVRRDKVDEALAALDEARSHESHLVQKTQRVNANLTHERRAWFDRTAGDVRYAIRELVVREIESERRTLAVLEAVRPDVRAIDSSGGLSRLGREATPAARRATLQSSQGPKGDAWSGVPRRSGDGLDRSISGSFIVPTPGKGTENDENDGDGSSVKGRGPSGSRSDSQQGRQSLQEDDDRVDARNAASRLAASTF